MVVKKRPIQISNLRLAFFYLLGAGIASVLFLFALSRVDRQAFQEQERIFTDQQFLQTYLVRQSVEEYLGGRIAQSGILAVHTLPEFAAGRRSRETIDARLEIEQGLDPGYQAHAFLAAPDRPVIDRYARSADRPWLERVIREWASDSWEDLASLPTEPPSVVVRMAVSGGRRILGFLLPVRAEAGLRGVLAVAVDLAPLIERMIIPMRSGRLGSGFLLDGEGTVLHDAEPANIGRNVLDGLHADRPDLLRLDRRLLDEPNGRGEYRLGERRMLVAWHAAEVGGRKLVVGLAAPDSEIRDAMGAWRAQRLLLSVSLALFLLAGTVGLFYARQRILENWARTLSAEVSVRTAELREEVERRRQREEALAASEARQRVILEGLPDMVFLVDGEGRFQFVNETAAASVGKTAKDLTGHRQEEFFSAEEIARTGPRIREVMSKGVPVHEEHRMQIPGRGTLWLEADLLPMKDASGKTMAVLGISREITARKTAEEERRRMEERIRWAQKMESLGSLAGGIAHDFNNMLMAIKGNAELARQDLPADSPTRASLMEIEAVARRASQLSAQMLTYAGKGRMVQEAVALSDTIRAMDAMLLASVSKKADLRYELADGLTPVQADPAQIRQMVMNLVVNASESLGDAEGTIRIATGVADCDRHTLARGRVGEGLPAGRYLFLEIEDTGCGMDAAVQERAFDPFFSTKFPGRGLGLPAVLGIVRGHRGTILVDSEPGKGTTVRVLLPAAGAAAEPDRGDLAPKRETWKGSGTVLLADDEEPVRRLCRRMLERLGFAVLTAADGRQALEIFRERGAEIRCVILDWTMPVMDGKETLGELRRLDGNVRVILSSGYGEEDLAEREGHVDVAGFIQKPYGMANLGIALQAVLGDNPSGTARF